MTSTTIAETIARVNATIPDNQSAYAKKLCIIRAWEAAEPSPLINCCVKATFPLLLVLGVWWIGLHNTLLELGPDDTWMTFLRRLVFIYWFAATVSRLLYDSFCRYHDDDKSFFKNTFVAVHAAGAVLRSACRRLIGIEEEGQ